MPTKREQRAEVNNFVQGLVTEASPLNFPENASVDEENFELNRDGSRSRRLGMDLEANSQLRGVSATLDQFPVTGKNTFKWIEVGGDPNLELLVVQVGQDIHLYDASVEDISRDGLRAALRLDNFPAGAMYSFAAVEGMLVVVAGVETIAIIEPTGGSYVISYDRLLIRDVFGVEEFDNRYVTDVTYRGPDFDSRHYYNLQNQSWGIPRRSTLLDVNKSYDPVRLYHYEYVKMPSNGEQVWPGLQYQPVTGDERPYERIWVNLYEDVIGAEVKAARGYYIIDALRRGTSRQEQVYLNHIKYPVLFQEPTDISQFYPSNLQLRQDTTPNGASCIAEFAGRVFYSGFNGTVIDGDIHSPNYSNFVFFSQLVKGKNDIKKCYQEGDPTSREASDLIDTDGGFLRISEASSIIALITLNSQMIVIAKNGVWSIGGGSDYGFNATNYKVVKLSTYGGISPQSIVVEGDQAFYWSNDGIYMIGRNQYGDFEVKSITLATIQKYYQSIPSYAKQTCVGGYDLITKQVRWVFSPGWLGTPGIFATELIFDTALGAFYKHSIPADRILPIGLIQSSAFSIGTSVDPVVVNGDAVVVDGEGVLVTLQVRSPKLVAVKYVILYHQNNALSLGFSLYRDTGFRDWRSVDNVGTDARAFCLTGSQTAGDVAVDKQIPYLTTVMRRTQMTVDDAFNAINDSSCIIRCQWAFANGIQSNRWSRPFQAYRERRMYFPTSPDNSIDNGMELVVTKSKVRGRGESFAFHFETEPYKDCQLIGWNLAINGNSKT